VPPVQSVAPALAPIEYALITAARSNRFRLIVVLLDSGEPGVAEEILGEPDMERVLDRKISRQHVAEEMQIDALAEGTSVCAWTTV